MIRVLLFALRFKRLKRENPHLFDGALAIESLKACFKQDGHEWVDDA